MSPIDQPDALQSAVDEVVTSWADVKARNVFGHRGYVRGRKMFGFLPESGVSVKAATASEAAELYTRDGVTSFEYNSMPMRQWPVLPLRSDDDLDPAIEALRRSYEAAG